MFMVVVSFSTTFSATSCQRAANFNIKLFFLLNLGSQSKLDLIYNRASSSSSVVVDLVSKVSATAEEEVQYFHHDRHHLTSSQMNSEVFYVPFGCILLSNSGGHVPQ